MEEIVAEYGDEDVVDNTLDVSSDESEPEPKEKVPNLSEMEEGQTVHFAPTGVGFSITRIDPISWVIEQDGRSDYKRWGDFQQTNQDLAYIEVMGEMPPEVEMSLRSASKRIR